MDKGAKKILIGVASGREDDVFLASLSNLVKEMKGFYEVAVLVEKWKFLPEAQNRITKYFLDNDFDYLLFLDDDHSGHSKAMVDALVNANAYMATMKTYVRHFPYPVALFKRARVHGVEKMLGYEQEKGYAEVDMTGFPMTLLRRDLFTKLEAPYFIGRCDGGRDWATDKYFCERLEKIGIKPVGCYDFCLEHAGITQENVAEYREKNSKRWIDRFVLVRSLTRE